MSLYKALYRRYRPNNFNNIVGQEHVITTLKNAIAQQKIGHAYLFHGPRGTGKTSVAKIFAAAVNCSAKDNSNKPCHQCENCQLMDSEQATDIIELDAASNNGVDEIRQIREFVRYAPTYLPYKIYIIDEVHMLSLAAFNALLKTLEEPPAHVIFILATTEIHKIPPTIISRCQRFDFKKVNTGEMIEGLHPVLKNEHIKMSDEALVYLATHADGSMRDALSILDQVRSYTTKKIEIEDLHQIIGTVGHDVYTALLKAVLAHESSTIMHLLGDIIASGKNVQLFVEGFLQYLLDEVEHNLKTPGEVPTPTLFLLLEKMNQLAGAMRTAFLPQVALQATFLELAQAADCIVLQSVDIPKESGIAREVTKDEANADETACKLKTSGKTKLRFQTDQDGTTDSEKIANSSKMATASINAIENSVITDEKLARESMGQAIPQAVKKLEKSSKTTDKEVTSNVTKPIKTSDTATTTFSQIAKTAQNPAAQTALPDNNRSEDEALIQKYEELKREQHRILLWHAMTEVALNHEANQIDKVKRKWQSLKVEPTNQILMMLKDTEPKIATARALVLTSNNKSLVNQLTMDSNKANAETFISQHLGQAYKMIVIDDEQWQQERSKFSQDWKANRVSKKTLEAMTKELTALEQKAKVEGIENFASSVKEVNDGPVVEHTEPVVKEAIDLFGADLVEVKSG